MNNFGVRQLRRMMQAASPRRANRAEGWLDSETERLSVNPRATDSRISEWLEPHLVVKNPLAAPNGHLFVFLAGSISLPGRQTLLLRLAAKMGFLAINLRYPNSWTVGGLCRRSADPHCHEKIRLHIADGLPSGELPGVSPHDSIHGRLGSLLVWLAANEPDAGWKTFMHYGEIRWDRIVLAGHSQGGGHAAILGKRHSVKRVVMLGSPTDDCQVSGGPASWLGAPGYTQSDRYYGFVHAEDPGFDRILAAWKALGLTPFGGLVNVDNDDPPYQMSHQLISQAPALGDKFHACVATDGATPISAAGIPIYASVWSYLLNVPDSV
jgi:hypothetical protein